MKARILLGITLLLLGIGCISQSEGPQTQPSQGAPSMDETQSMDDTLDEERISMDEVAENDGPESCWTIVDDKVYDVTDFAGKHKGGNEKILTLCGGDGSDAVRGQHGMSKDDTLEGYYLGDLA